MTAILICVAWLAVGGAVGAFALRGMTDEEWRYAVKGTPLTPESGQVVMRVLIAAFWPLWLIQQGWSAVRRLLERRPGA